MSDSPESLFRRVARLEKIGRAASREPASDDELIGALTSGDLSVDAFHALLEIIEGSMTAMLLWRALVVRLNQAYEDPPMLFVCDPPTAAAFLVGAPTDTDVGCDDLAYLRTERQWTPQPNRHRGVFVFDVKAALTRELLRRRGIASLRALVADIVEDPASYTIARPDDVERQTRLLQPLRCALSGPLLLWPSGGEGSLTMLELQGVVLDSYGPEWTYDRTEATPSAYDIAMMAARRETEQ